MYRKIVRKNLKQPNWPFQMFSDNLSQKDWYKFGMAKNGDSKLIKTFLVQKHWKKIVGKNLECPFLAILNLYQSFWEKLSERIQNGHFWLFQIFSDNFSVHITLIECNGL